MIIALDSLAEIANSNLVSGIANISQFYNIYQSTKAANYSQIVSELQNQNAHIDKLFDEQTHTILNELAADIQIAIEQNNKIIQQNEELLKVLRSDDNGNR
jgi:uncharacterized protein YdcH (DUF465 family)